MTQSPQTQPPQPPFGQQPGPHMPPPPPRRKTGRKVLISVGAVLAALILIGVGAAVGGDDDSDSASEKPAAEQPKDDEKPRDEKPAAKEDPPAEEPPAAEGPVKVEARATEFAPTVLHDGGDYTSVLVTVTNNGDKNLDVNPLYFEITDTTGTKHSADALGMDENQIDTVNLAPGERATGAVTAEGGFEAGSVTFTEGFATEPIKVDVSP